MAIVAKTPTAMREAVSNTRPNFEVPDGCCDTHFHVFEPGYTSVPNPRYTFPEGTIRQYLELCDVLHIQRMVHVQASYYNTNSDVTLRFLREIGDRARGVVMIDENASDGELDEQHRLGVRALRIDLFLRQNWPNGDKIAYIEKMIARAKPRGWHIQFYSPGTVIRDLLPYLADLDFDFVVDHMGYMIEDEGATQEHFQQLLQIMKRGRCWIKLTGAERVAKGRPLDVVIPIASAIVQTRPDRVLWGTDWPHLPNGQTDTGGFFNLLPLWAPDSNVRKLILADNPAKLFFAGA